MQTNVQHGERVFVAKVNLAGKQDRLVKLASELSGTRTMVQLPTSVTDLTPYVVTDTNTGIGANVSVLPLSPDQNVRVALKGTCTPGTLLALAAPGDDGADAGKVTALPSDAGNYRVVGIAEEQGVDGQSVLMRPYFDLVTVTE